jgi:CPA1 family monovalent cation:H+ antiporter
MEKPDEDKINQFHKVQKELLQTERKFVIDLRKTGNISDEVLRKIEYELDLEETRLMLEQE